MFRALGKTAEKLKNVYVVACMKSYLIGAYKSKST